MFFIPFLLGLQTYHPRKSRQFQGQKQGMPTNGPRKRFKALLVLDKDLYHPPLWKRSQGHFCASFFQHSPTGQFASVFCFVLDIKKVLAKNIQDKSKDASKLLLLASLVCSRSLLSFPWINHQLHIKPFQTASKRLKIHSPITARLYLFPGLNNTCGKVQQEQQLLVIACGLCHLAYNLSLSVLHTLLCSVPGIRAYPRL